MSSSSAEAGAQARHRSASSEARITVVVLGKLASEVATLLRGKHKPTWAPHVDGGDHVIVLAATLPRSRGTWTAFARCPPPRRP